MQQPTYLLMHWQHSTWVQVPIPAAPLLKQLTVNVPKKADENDPRAYDLGSPCRPGLHLAQPQPRKPFREGTGFWKISFSFSLSLLLCNSFQIDKINLFKSF